jgi:putative ABC transport system permease protein
MAAFSLILTGAFALPGLIRLVFPALSQLVYQLLGRDAQLAVLSLHAALGKTTVAVASLMIGIAMMVSLAVMIASFRQTVTDWVDQSMRADLWIEPAAKTVTKRAGFLSPQLLAQVQQLPGVTAVDPFLDVPITYAGQPANLGVGDVALLLQHGQLRWLTPTSSSQVLARLSRQPGVLLTESFARKHQLTAGDAVTLASPQGPVTLSVVAVYADYASEHGYIIVPRRWYEATFHDFRLNGLAVYTQAGVSSVKVKAALQQAVGPNTALTIRTNQELRQEVFRIFDQTFQITYALHAITIVVSVISVMNTLFALVLGDKREYGILKYLGLSRKQLMRMVFTQAAVLGVVGQGMGWLVGWGLSVVLIEVVNKQSFGWTIQMLWPWPYLLQSFGLVMLAAVVSAWWPARQAAKTPAPEAVRVE